MDPIHPIVPQPPALPPITPAPTAGRVDRDTRRPDPGPDGKRRRRPAPAQGRRPTQAYERGDDGGLHIDLTA